MDDALDALARAGFCDGRGVASRGVALEGWASGDLNANAT
jgi:hypothetical protein